MLERMSSENVRFVLVEPQYAGNTGSTARALKNLGFSRLVLVRPEFRLDDPEARKMAVDARDVLAAARGCDDLDEALDGAQATIGTSRRTGKHRRPHWRLDPFAPQLARLAAAGELAIVFGREDSGLNDGELEDARWFTRKELRSGFPKLPFRISIARRLVNRWIELADGD